MRYLLRFPLLVLATAFVCQFTQGQTNRDSPPQWEEVNWPSGVDGRDAHAKPRVQSPLSQFHVIDTALVLRPEGDTLRNVYTFNARGKRILDLEQKLVGAEWANSRRITNTYDGQNNMLTEAHEYWENPVYFQWQVLDWQSPMVYKKKWDSDFDVHKNQEIV